MENLEYIVFTLLQGFCILIMLVFISKCESFDYNKLWVRFKGKKAKPSEFRIDVSGLRHDKIDKCVRFKLDIKCQGVSWNVLRRYSEFPVLLEMNEEIIETRNLRFPTKGNFFEKVFGQNESIEFLEKRKVQLHFFLKMLFLSEAEFIESCIKDRPFGKRLGKVGEFFCIPDDIDLPENERVSRVELLKTGIDGFRILMNQVKLINPVGSGSTSKPKAPWEWLCTSDSKRTNTYTWLDDEKLHVTVKTKLPCQRDHLVDVFFDDSVREKWDANHDHIEILEKFAISTNDVSPAAEAWLKSQNCQVEPDEALQPIIQEFEEEFKGYKLLFCSVQYNTLKSPAPLLVSKRELLSVSLIAEDVKGVAYMVLRHVDFPLPVRLQNKSGFVRGKLLCSASVMEKSPDSPHETLFTSLTMMDPGVYVPPKVIKMFTPQRANDVEKLGPVASEYARENAHGLSLLFTKN